MKNGFLKLNDSFAKLLSIKTDIIQGIKLVFRDIYLCLEMRHFSVFSEKNQDHFFDNKYLWENLIDCYDFAINIGNYRIDLGN